MESIGPLMATPLRDTAYGELVAGGAGRKVRGAIRQRKWVRSFLSFDEIIGRHFRRWADKLELPVRSNVGLGSMSSFRQCADQFRPTPESRHFQSQSPLRICARFRRAHHDIQLRN